MPQAGAARQHRPAVQVAQQVFPQLARRRIAPVRMGFQAFENHRFKIGRRAFVYPAQGNDLLPGHGHGDGPRIAPAVRRLPAANLVERGTQAVHVGAPVDGRALPAHLLRRHVAPGSQDHSALRAASLLAEIAHQPEVGHPGMQGLVIPLLDEDIGGLHVAVNKPLAVGGVQRLGHLAPNLGFLLEVQSGGPLRQRPAVNALHGDKGLSVQLAGFVDAAHAGMLQPGLGPGLAQQPVLARRAVAPQQLQGHFAAEHRVPGAVDYAHAPHAEHAGEHEAPEAAPVQPGLRGGRRPFSGPGFGGRFHGRAGGSGIGRHGFAGTLSADRCHEGSISRDRNRRFRRK